MKHLCVLLLLCKSRAYILPRLIPHGATAFGTPQNPSDVVWSSTFSEQSNQTTTDAPFASMSMHYYYCNVRPDDPSVSCFQLADDLWQCIRDVDLHYDPDDSY